MSATLAIAYWHVVDTQQSALAVQNGVHTSYALPPTVMGQFSAQKLRPECGASTWLSQQHYCNWHMLNVV